MESELWGIQIFDGWDLDMSRMMDFQGAESVKGQVEAYSIE